MLLLLRHGETKANRRGQWHGTTDGRLTRKGRRQAARTADYLGRHLSPVAIFTSPLRRCTETAETVGERLELRPVVVDDLREYALGDWEGLTMSELNSRHGFTEATKADIEFAPPNGESISGVSLRVTSALRRLYRGSTAPVLVVGHGVAFAVALSTLIDNQPTGWGRYKLSNCSLTQLTLSPNPHIGFLNMHFHLL